jgi:hypothetical protein
MTLVDKAAFSQMTATEYNELLALVRNPYVRKTATGAAINNNTTLATDPQLVVPLTRVSSTFTFMAWLIINSNATADFKFGFNVPAASTMKWAYQEGTPASLVAVLQGVFTESGVAGINATGVDQLVIVTGQLFMGATPGDFSLRWAQNTANASDTFVKQDSYLQLWPV